MVVALLRPRSRSVWASWAGRVVNVSTPARTGVRWSSRLSHPGRDVMDVLRARGACFFTDLARLTRRLPSEVEDALWELTAGGLVTADGFENLRALIDPKRRRGEGKGSTARPRHAAGRWALVTHVPDSMAESERTLRFARQLLLRWGVLLRRPNAGASQKRSFRPDLPHWSHNSANSRSAANGTAN